MRQARRITAAAVLAALAWTGPAGAEDAFIRIEAKRGEAAEAAAARWRDRFPDVVTFPLAQGWTGIGLGPLAPADAAARMARLKAAGEIPSDSYLTGPGGTAPLSGLSDALRGGAESADGAAVSRDSDAPVEAAAADTTTSLGTVGATGAGGSPASPLGSLAAPDSGHADGAEPVAAAGTLPVGAGAGVSADPAPASDVADTENVPAPVDTSPRHIQLQATPGSISAAEALAKWQRSFPGARLWRLPGGWFAIALPPLPADEAQERLLALKAARQVPGDAFLVTPGELGEQIEPQPLPAAPEDTASQEAAGTGPQPAGSAAPDAEAQPAAEPVPAPAAVMPPMLEVQRALHWAGLYDGALDGQPGPATRKAIDAQIAASGGDATPAEAIVALIAAREDWRREMGLKTLDDEATGLALLAPTGKLAFDRTERALSIYGPRDGSGAALILFSQPGGQQEMLDLAGLVTALGWVPHPDRDVGKGRFTLTGANTLHSGHAEGRVKDGVAEGWVLIWPAADAENARRLAIEASDSFRRTAPARTAAETAPRP